MKNTYTLLETITTFDGNTVIYRPDLISNFFRDTFEKNHSVLSQQHKEETFLVDEKYGDLLDKIWRERLHDILINYHGADWGLKSDERNPIEEHEHQMSLDKDADLTDEQHNLKLERLRLHREWFENQ